MRLDARLCIALLLALSAWQQADAGLWDFIMDFGRPTGNGPQLQEPAPIQGRYLHPGGLRTIQRCPFMPQCSPGCHGVFCTLDTLFSCGLTHCAGSCSKVHFTAELNTTPYAPERRLEYVELPRCQRNRHMRHICRRQRSRLLLARTVRRCCQQLDEYVSTYLSGARSFLAHAQRWALCQLYHGHGRHFHLRHPA